MWVKVVQASPNAGEYDPLLVPLFSYTTLNSPTAEDFSVALKPQPPFPAITVKMPQGGFHFVDPGWFYSHEYPLGSSFGLDDWHHLAITGAPGDPAGGSLSWLKIYVDGVPPPSTPNEHVVHTPNPAPGDGGSVVLAQGQSDYKTLHHGPGHAEYGYDNYNTFLAEVRFWNLARTPEQVLANYLERCTSLKTWDFPHPCLCTARPVKKNETSRKVHLHAPIPHPSRRITVFENGLVAVWSLNCNFNDVVGTHGFGRL